MESKNHFFKIPFNVQKDKENAKIDNNLHIVGIIDASGSMASWWKWVAEFYNVAIPQDSLKTFTFDHRVQHCDTNKLTDRIQNHGGGRTAIPEVFAEFEKHLQTVPMDKNITVLFISDGQDNSLHTLEQRMNKLKGNNEDRKINFVCLGIKSGFPTFLSMQLRKLYHRGDEAIPALFLVEYVSEKAFFNKFEGIKKYFYSSGSVQVEPAIQFFPWDESVTDSAYEGSWVITKADVVKVNGIEHKVQTENLNVEQLVEIFRGWVQQIQLNSLTDMKEAQEIAKIALGEMKRLIEKSNQEMGLNVLMKLDEQNNKVGDAFAMRAKKNYIIRYGGKLQWFLDEIEQISKGINAKADNEFEAAKRMNIGTITGKYQQKVLALKNIPANKFLEFVQEFKQKLQEAKIEKPEGEGQISCVKQILLQNDFVSGLDYITNQYDFVEMFELTGNGFKLKRTDQTETNPYQAEGKGVSRKILDWPSIIQKDFRIQVKGKDQILFSQTEISALEDGFVDEINAIIPFFSKNLDSDISQLLNSNLMHMAFSYLITQNADILIEDSYLILVGHFLTVIFNQFNQQQKQEKQEFLQKAYESLHVYYKFNQSFQQRALLLNKNPQIYFKNYGDDHVLKTLTMVFYLVQGGQINQQQKEKLFEIFNLYFFNKFVKQFNSDINKILKPEITEKEKDIMRKYFQENINSYYSISAFRKGFSLKLEELLQKSSSDAVIPKKDLYNNDKNDLSLQTLEAFGKLMLEKSYKYTDYSMMAKHVCQNPEKYLETEVNWDLQDLNKVVLSQINQENIKFMPGYSVFFEEIEQLYTQNFQQNHWGIRPIKQEEVKQICKEKGIEYGQLKFTISGLLENACCARNCSFFLQPREDLDKHLAGWQGKIPKGFHRFVNSRLEMSSKQLMKQAKLKWGKAFPNKYGVDEKYVMKYFQETLEAYQINKYGEIKQVNDEEELKREKEFNESITGIVKQRWLKKIEKQGVNPFQGNQLKQQYKAIISEEPQQQLKQDLQQQQNQKKNKEPWMCQSCTVENPGENDICFVCQWNPKKPDEWHCSECTFLNNPKHKKCIMCDQGVKPVRKEIKIEKPKEEQKKQDDNVNKEKQEEQQKEKSKFEQNQEQIPEILRKKWNNEQKYLKTLLTENDEHLSFKAISKPLENNKKNLEFEGLKYVAGVDISFSQDVENLACSYLAVLSFPSLEIVYEDFEFIKLDQPYVSGFLAFREAAHILKLFEKLFKNKPEINPQVVMVDGNGILHQNGCGLASHLGILLDIPTIGVAKTTFYADGLTKDVVLKDFQEVAQQKGDYSYLKGQSGRIWGAALKSEQNVKNPIYVSIGTNISLDTACQLVQQCRIPEPVRIADLNSREQIRNLKNPDEKQLAQDNKLPFLTEFIEDEFPDNPEADENLKDGQHQNLSRAERRKQHKKNQRGKKGGYRGKKK
ncbi:hypothetical protein PPERSA_03784 [Pseudocohnilembus persalinus]|uniref:RanBP2-type domain-containing protein n=1 Tax=Pseudocohnilembus persalinus TaxID=266149 RepID=A0A0V0QUE4_PSEPJ|nr:hypothetical protein PPERSA_03784 [Pseudocohnilembus persalinus]|eukprot:KRX05847.1 hypothetical protein PPERSA_03784 [Pseudocohnilembus persalinus]